MLENNQVDIQKYNEQSPATSYLKIDTAKMVLLSGQEDGRLKPDEVTPGMRLMAKMLVKENDSNQLEARPAGFAIGFTREPRGQEDASRLLFSEGHLIFTSPININGKQKYLAADKKGVMLIEGNNLNSKTRSLFDQVGNQENNFWIKTNDRPNLREKPPSGLTVVLLPDNDPQVPELVKQAAKNSLEEPFISTSDYYQSPNRPLETKPSLPATLSLDEIDF